MQSSIWCKRAIRLSSPFKSDPTLPSHFTLRPPHLYSYVAYIRLQKFIENTLQYSSNEPAVHPSASLLSGRTTPRGRFVFAAPAEDRRSR